MPYWLVESDLTLYAMLACVALVSLAAWWQSRRRKYAIVAGVAAVSLIGLISLDRFVESDREQMVRKLRDIAEGVQVRDFSRVFRHVSVNFQRGSFDKVRFREFAEIVSRARNVTEFQPWDFVPGDVSREKQRGELQFRFKIRGNWSAGGEFFLAKTIWVLDSDGDWRLQTFEVFNPYVQTNSPIDIPGWGR